MIAVYVMTPQMAPIQTIYFENAYKAEPFIEEVRKSGYLVKVFVGNSTVPSIGE